MEGRKFGKSEVTLSKKNLITPPGTEGTAFYRQQMSGEELLQHLKRLKNKDRAKFSPAYRRFAQTNFFKSPSETLIPTGAQQLINDSGRKIVLAENPNLLVGVEKDKLNQESANLLKTDLENFEVKLDKLATEGKIEPSEKNQMRDEYTGARKTHYRVRQRLLRHFKNQTDILLEAYSQAVQNLVIQIVESGINDNKEEADHTLRINWDLEVGTRVAKINLHDDGKVHLEQTLGDALLKEKQDAEIKTRNTFPFSTKLDLEAIVIDGKAGFTVSNLMTSNEYVWKIAHGETIPSATIKQSYKESQIFPFNRAWLDFVTMYEGLPNTHLKEQVLSFALSFQALAQYLDKAKLSQAELEKLLPTFIEILSTVQDLVLFPLKSPTVEHDLRMALDKLDESIRPLVLAKIDTLDKFADEADIPHHFKTTKLAITDLLAERHSTALYIEQKRLHDELHSKENKSKEKEGFVQIHKLISESIPSTKEYAERHQKYQTKKEDSTTRTYTKSENDPTRILDANKLKTAKSESFSNISKNYGLNLANNPDAEAIIQDTERSCLHFNGKLPSEDLIASATRENVREFFNTPKKSKHANPLLPKKGNNLFEKLEKHYHQGLQSDTSKNIDTVLGIFGIKIKDSKARGPVAFISEKGVTANLRESYDGNTYLELISTDKSLRSSETFKTLNNIPGIVMLRYVLTEDGFKSDPAFVSNPLLASISLNHPNRVAEDLYNKIRKASEDEKNNFNKAIATSNAEVRRIWGSLNDILLNIGRDNPQSTRGYVNTSDSVIVDIFKELTNQVIADPFNETLLIAYRNHIQEAIKKNPGYSSVESPMEDLIKECQLQKRKATLAEVSQLTYSLFMYEPTYASVKKFYDKAILVAEMGMEPLAAQMITTLNQHSPNLVQLVLLKRSLEKQIPSGVNHTLGDFLTNEKIFSLPKTVGTYFEIDKDVNTYSSPSLEKLREFITNSTTANHETLQALIQLTAMDELFDNDGKVRKDIAAILNVSEDLEEPSKKKMLKAYVTKFIFERLDLEKLDAQAKTDIQKLQQDILTKIDGININRDYIYQIQESLLDQVDAGKAKQYASYIEKLTYERNRFHLQKTLFDTQRTERRQADGLYKDALTDLHNLGTAIFNECEIDKNTHQTTAGGNLSGAARGLLTADYAINNPTAPNLEKCADVGEKLGKRSGFKIVGGLLLALTGVLLVTISIAAIPLSKFILTPLSIEGIKFGSSIVLLGFVMAGLVASAAGLELTKKASETIIQDKHGPTFFQRIRYKPIRRYMQNLPNSIKTMQEEKQKQPAVLPHQEDGEDKVSKIPGKRKA